MNCRIAHLCGRLRVFFRKVDRSDEASEATRALLEIIGHAVVLLNNNEQALFFLNTTSNRP